MEKGLTGCTITMLFRKGAEADLYKEEWYGLQAIRKSRIQKKYRVDQLDSEIRRSRTVREARLLYEACRVGVPTPSIYFIDLDEAAIIMEYIEGDKLRDAMSRLGQEELERVLRTVGQQIGTLHRNNIIHGDLTTSNMILTPSGKVFFIDFGLGEFSSSIEEKGVDLHLMHRALESTHYRQSIRAFQLIIQGYGLATDKMQIAEVLGRVRQIELRGRYFRREAKSA
jgi:TP53 regulating kinase-like protein